MIIECFIVNVRLTVREIVFIILNWKAGNEQYQSVENTASRNRTKAVTGLAEPRRSSESSSLSLTLKKGEDISFLDWSLHISHQVSVIVPDEPDLNLCNTSSWS